MQEIFGLLALLVILVSALLMYLFLEARDNLKQFQNRERLNVKKPTKEDTIDSDSSNDN